jgi:hypothetical protein
VAGTVYASVYPSWRDKNVANERARVVFENNHGGDAMTQPVALMTLGGSTVHVTAYGTPLQPRPSFALIDGYGNTKTLTVLSASVVASVFYSFCYSPRNPEGVGYLSGTLTATTGFLSNLVTFDNLYASCYPGGNMTVIFTASFYGFDSIYDVNTSVTLMFRHCVDGEYLQNNECVRCPEGSYSLRYSPTAQCIPCPPNTDSCSGNVVAVSQQYWAPSPLSTVFLDCPYPAGCAGGGNVTALQKSGTAGATSRCATGYGGPLCGVCSKGYFLNRSTKECTSCAGNNGPGQLVALILVPLLLLALAFLVFSRLDVIKEALNNALNTSRRTESNASIGEAASNALLKGIEGLSKLIRTINYDQVVPKIKISVSCLQIITNFPDGLNIHFPKAVGNTMSGLGFVNLMNYIGSAAVRF